MAGSGGCIFCGAVGTMTGEDVLGQWLKRIDLDQSPVPGPVGAEVGDGGRVGEAAGTARNGPGSSPGSHLSLAAHGGSAAGCDAVARTAFLISSDRAGKVVASRRM